MASRRTLNKLDRFKKRARRLQQQLKPRGEREDVGVSAEQLRHSLTRTQKRVRTIQRAMAVEERRTREAARAYHQRVVRELVYSVERASDKYPQFSRLDLLRARAYMLGQTHGSPVLPLFLAVAVSEYRQRRLQEALRHQCEISRITFMSINPDSLEPIVERLSRNMEELLEGSDGLRVCAEWDSACISKGNRRRPRRVSPRQAPRSWKLQVLRVYLKNTGVAGLQELCELADVTVPAGLLPEVQTA